jgi:nitrate reductase NapE component
MEWLLGFHISAFCEFPAASVAIVGGESSFQRCIILSHRAAGM